MTSSTENDSPTRAVVLGGGGSVGISWQVGLLMGLREIGVDLATSEATVGTSAGAFVGALLSGRRDLGDALVGLAHLGKSIDPTTMASRDEALLDIIQKS